LRLALSVFLISTILAVPTHAYDYPLSPNAIREAYFLGQRRDDKTAQFLGKYVKHPALPDEGPYVSEISVLTPYAQVVFGSWRSTVGYSAQDAQQDYLSQEGTIQVKVRIEFTATYNAVRGVKPVKNAAGKEGFILRQQDFWRDFRFNLTQATRAIKTRGVRGTAIYDRSGLRGAQVWLEYDPREVASGVTSVEIVTPDNDHIAAEFDLTTLR